MTAVLAICVAFFGAWMLYRVRSRQILRLKSYERHAKLFFDAAAPLIQDDETPEVVLDFLGFLNVKLTDPKAARQLFHFIKRGRMVPQSPAAREALAALRTFFAERPELERPYLEAVLNGVLAMTYKSLFWGWVIRVWLSALDTPQRQEEVVAAYRDLDRSNGWHSNGTSLQAAAA